QRKNGLFKKAYELGVLCSVDVAVIILVQERPGHHVKLYQYCSTDIHDIVGRHMKHDGEKDTKGPNDFQAGMEAKPATIWETEKTTKQTTTTRSPPGAATRGVEVKALGLG
ncbi:hypothetical protein BKA70DRAFT_1113556, partial [Coprinopsis sp. MPI-PUGE-AT-0042]